MDGDRYLRDFVIDVCYPESKFRRGHTYYEFTNEVENILEGKEVLLQDKRTKKWFQLAPPEEVAAGRLKLYGEGIACSSFGDQYRVFIQSFGSGARHLTKSSSILYNHSVDQVSIINNNYPSNMSKTIDYNRWSLMSFHWYQFAQSILLTKSLTQRVEFLLKNFVHKIC